jgi:hypothetical protein
VRCRAVSHLWLEEEVRRATREISQKFVVEPTIDEIESDLLIGIRRYICSVRIKHHQTERLHKEGIDPDTADVSLSTPLDQDEGLGMNLRPTSGNFLDNTLPASPEVEAYLNDVTRELTNHIDKMKTADTRKKHNIAIRINSLLRELGKRDDQVVAPTDKTNSNTIISFDAVNMHPSVKFIQIERAVKYFLRDVPAEDIEIRYVKLPCTI